MQCDAIRFVIDPNEEAYLSMKAGAHSGAASGSELARIKSARSGTSASSSTTARSVGPALASNSVHWDRSRIDEELAGLDAYGMLLRVPDASAQLLLILQSPTQATRSLTVCPTAEELVQLLEYSTMPGACSAQSGADRTEGAHV